MKKILLIAFVFWAKLLVAQEETARSFVWGAVAGFEAQPLGIQSLLANEPEQMKVEPARPSHGGSLGVFGRWQIWHGLSVRPGLSVSLLRAKIQFSEDGEENFQFTDMEMPLHFVLTNPNGQFPLRGSILLGGRIGWNFAPQNSDNLRLLNERLGLDVGLGVEIRMKTWRLQPELVYSHCMNNLHDVTNAKYDWAVGRVVRDKLTLRMLIWRENEK